MGRVGMVGVENRGQEPAGSRQKCRDFAHPIGGPIGYGAVLGAFKGQGEPNT
jgi:hypothetical protein